MLIADGDGAALFAGALAGFVVVVGEVVAVEGGGEGVGAAGGVDGVVGGDVWGLVGVGVVLGGGGERGEGCGDGVVFGAFEEAREGGGVGFAYGGAVPAGAFRVELVVHFLVRFARPFEGGGELVFVDLVVVIDEFLGFADGVVVVGFWGELMRVPCEVEVKGGDRNLPWIQGDDLHVALVFGDEAVHRRCDSGGVNPVD